MREDRTFFSELLTRAINRIHANECKKKTVIRDELGYAAGREGRTAIDYWCRDGGHIPADCDAIEGLAREIARRKGLDFYEMEAFLASAGYPNARAFANELCPKAPAAVAAQREELVVSSAPCPQEEDAEETKPPPVEADPITAKGFEPFESVAPSESPITDVNKRPHVSKALIWGAVFLLALAVVSFTSAAISARSAGGLFYREPGQIYLIGLESERVLLTPAEGGITSPIHVLVNSQITATLTVINVSAHPIHLRRLQLAARGPGVTCSDDEKARWSAPNVSFPAVTNLHLAPGERYRYQMSRPFYLPGSYFLEPVEQDINGNWGGIPPFTCTDLAVVEQAP